MSETKNAQHITDQDFDEVVKNAGMPVFIDFHAEWCPPCKLAAPVVEKLAGEYKNKVKIVEIDTDESRESARRFGIMSIPTVVILKAENGEMKEIARKVGFPGESGYRQLLEQVSGETAVA